MSQDTETDKSQGTPSLEERIEAATTDTPQESPQEEQQEAPAPMPSAPEEDQSSQEDSLQEETGEDDLQLPEDSSERTKEQFEKLKAQLRERNERIKSLEQPQQQPTSIFDDFRMPGADVPSANDYQGLTQQQINEMAPQFVNEDGELDVENFNRALQDANQRVLAAEEKARQALDRVTRYEESQQLREAYRDYPDLDPQHKGFDRQFYDLVSQTIMVENHAKGGNITLKQAADHVSNFYKRPETNIQKVKDEAVEEYKASQAKRAQGPVETGKGQSRESLDDYQELRRRSRQGDNDAIAKRLAGLGI